MSSWQERFQMYNYCTLFDSNYLTRGLAMYESLKKYCDEFHLYIYAFDDKCYDLLLVLGLEHATIISLSEFESEQLLMVKDDRTVAEYCWTCTPFIIKYSLDVYHLECCTYLDADLYFFGSPSVLIDEMQGASVLITEHRYTEKYDSSETSGVYCVQFMVFNNNENGLRVLNWWKDACLDWCYARYEDGKFGDQKYLDDWVDRFEGVHVLQNLGGGVAPWNIQQYDLADDSFNIIFYHFHDLKFDRIDRVDLGGYDLSMADISMLYKPYVEHLNQINDKLKSVGSLSDYNYISENNVPSWRGILSVAKRIIKGNYNVINRDSLIGLSS